MGRVGKKATLFLLLTFMVAIPVVLPSVAHGQIEPEKRIENPLGDVSFEIILIRVINWLLGIIVFLALIGVIFGGIRMIAAVGNEQQLATAKRIIFWSIAGLIVAILSLAIINIIVVELLLGVRQALLPAPYAFAQADNIPEKIGDLGIQTGLEPLSIFDLARNIVLFLSGLIALLSLTVFIIGAIWMIVSLGNEQRVARAKMIMTYAVVGLLLAGGAWVIISLVSGLIGVGT